MPRRAALRCLLGRPGSSRRRRTPRICVALPGQQRPRSARPCRIAEGTRHKNPAFMAFNNDVQHRQHRISSARHWEKQAAARSPRASSTSRTAPATLRAAEGAWRPSPTSVVSGLSARHHDHPARVASRPATRPSGHAGLGGRPAWSGRRQRGHRGTDRGRFSVPDENAASFKAYARLQGDGARRAANVYAAMTWDMVMCWRSRCRRRGPARRRRQSQRRDPRDRQPAGSEGLHASPRARRPEGEGRRSTTKARPAGSTSTSTAT